MNENIQGDFQICITVPLRNSVLKISSKFTGEHPYQSVMLCNFIVITFWHGCSPVNLLHIFRTPNPKNTSGWLLLRIFLLHFSKKTQQKSEIAY